MAVGGVVIVTHHRLLRSRRGAVERVVLFMAALLLARSQDQRRHTAPTNVERLGRESRRSSRWPCSWRSTVFTEASCSSGQRQRAKVLRSAFQLPPGQWGSPHGIDWCRPMGLTHCTRRSVLARRVCVFNHGLSSIPYQPATPRRAHEGTFAKAREDADSLPFPHSDDTAGHASPRPDENHFPCGTRCDRAIGGRQEARAHDPVLVGHTAR